MILDRLFIPVSNEARARAFYERVFGFVSLERVGTAANDNGGHEMRAPGVQLAITLVSPLDGLPIGSVQGAVLHVEDLRLARAHIEAQKVPVGPIERGPTGPFFHVTDPDGNGWIIRQT
jgi:catechol 2,3-dioxygenase-like lactoylglutathione lyase family enzyme